MPGFVATAMTGIKTPSLLAPDPVVYSRAAVATIGIQNNTYGYLYHSLQVTIIINEADTLIDTLLLLLDLSCCISS